MLKSRFCDCSNAYILVSGTKKIANTGAAAAPYKREKITIKICAVFADFLSKINNIYVTADFSANNNSISFKFKA